jgi:hypothetical protein
MPGPGYRRFHFWYQYCDFSLHFPNGCVFYWTFHLVSTERDGSKIENLTNRLCRRRIMLIRELNWLSHTMKTYWGLEVQLVILDLGTRWSRVVSTRYPLHRVLGSPQSRSPNCEEKISLRLSGIELRFFGRPARSVVVIPTPLCRTGFEEDLKSAFMSLMSQWRCR